MPTVRGDSDNHANSKLLTLFADQAIRSGQRDECQTVPKFWSAFKGDIVEREMYVASCRSSCPGHY